MFVEQNTVLLDVVVANKYSLIVIYILNLRSKIHVRNFLFKNTFLGVFLPIKQNNAGIYQCFALVRNQGRHSALKANTSCRPYKNLASPARRKQLTFQLSCCCFFHLHVKHTRIICACKTFKNLVFVLS